MIAILEGKRRTIEAEFDRRIGAEDRMARRRAILASIPGIATASQPSSSSRCRSSASSTARRRPAWRALRPIPRNQASLAHTTPSPAAVPACGQPSPWPRSLRCEPIPASSPSTSTSRAAGKPAKVALVAIARRIVTLANALLRDDITFKNASFARQAQYSRQGNVGRPCDSWIATSP